MTTLPVTQPDSHPTGSQRTSPADSSKSKKIRTRLTYGGLGLVALGLALFGLAHGDLALSLGQVLTALTGDAGFHSTVVLQWRLPRIVAAIAFGVSLGIAGALFQSITRNPLGSPDVIGFSTGSYTGVLLVTIVLGNSALSATAGALVGGLATAVIVYLLAYRQGVQGFRLIIVGIGVTAMLHAINMWVLLRAQAEIAMVAAMWGSGSLSLSAWKDTVPSLIALGIALPLVAAFSGALRQLELGDDAAAAHGVRVERSRLIILAIGVLLTALVTAAAGPIAFVALSAPQIAKRLTKTAGIPVIASALTGAIILLGADLLAQFALPQPLPVGVVTVVLGGIYLVTFLIKEARTS